MNTSNNILNQYVVSIHCINTLYQYIVSIHCINTLYQYMVSIHQTFIIEQFQVRGLGSPMGEMELNYLLIVPLNGDPIQVGFHIKNTIL
jgi:hypothetical protein